jgi:hypothetical protein
MCVDWTARRLAGAAPNTRQRMPSCWGAQTFYVITTTTTVPVMCAEAALGTQGVGPTRACGSNAHWHGAVEHGEMW